MRHESTQYLLERLIELQETAREIEMHYQGQDTLRLVLDMIKEIEDELEFRINREYRED